jgi:23S rRNA (guanosine2251-2'-O)-methyltransferase
MPEIIVIAHNIRSTHNVGAIFRSSEGFGVQKIILSGYTPYPAIPGDTRLPHIAQKLTDQIHKTALDAEVIVPFEHTEAPNFEQLRTDGYTIVGLEQAANSIPLPSYVPPQKVALLLGEEVEGIPMELLKECKDIIEIPMSGKKESFNVSVAAGIALYQLACC